MYSLVEPGRQRLQALLERSATAEFTYADVGLTFAHAGPKKYLVHQRRLQLGKGHSLFERARQGIRSWAMYPRALVTLRPQEPLVESGVVVASQIRVGGIWVTSPCRIVDVRASLDPVADIESYGFAYGTVAGHPLQGEELFAVEYHRADSSVWYHLFSFSRPVTLLPRLAYPWIRSLQRRFVTASANAMQAYCRQ